MAAFSISPFMYLGRTQLRSCRGEPLCSPALAVFWGPPRPPPSSVVQTVIFTADLSAKSSFNRLLSAVQNPLKSAEFAIPAGPPFVIPGLTVCLRIAEKSQKTVIPACPESECPYETITCDILYCAYIIRNCILRQTA